MAKYDKKIFAFGVAYTAPGNSRAACSIHPKGMTRKAGFIKKENI